MVHQDAPYMASACFARTSTCVTCHGGRIPRIVAKNSSLSLIRDRLHVPPASLRASRGRYSQPVSNPADSAVSHTKA